MQADSSDHDTVGAAKQACGSDPHPGEERPEELSFRESRPEGLSVESGFLPLSDLSKPVNSRDSLGTRLAKLHRQFLSVPPTGTAGGAVESSLPPLDFLPERAEHFRELPPPTRTAAGDEQESDRQFPPPTRAAAGDEQESAPSSSLVVAAPSPSRHKTTPSRQKNSLSTLSISLVSERTLTPSSVLSERTLTPINPLVSRRSGLFGVGEDAPEEQSFPYVEENPFSDIYSALTHMEQFLRNKSDTIRRAVAENVAASMQEIKEAFAEADQQRKRHRQSRPGPANAEQVQRLAPTVPTPRDRGREGDEPPASSSRGRSRVRTGGDLRENKASRKADESQSGGGVVASLLEMFKLQHHKQPGADLPVLVLPGTFSSCADEGDLFCDVLFGGAMRIVGVKNPCECFAYSTAYKNVVDETFRSIFFDPRESLTLLHNHLNGLNPKLSPDENMRTKEKYKNGFYLFGFSQGNVIARGYVQQYNYPTAKKWISLDGPVAGEFSMPDVLLIRPEQAVWLCSTLFLLKKLTWCDYLVSPERYVSGSLLEVWDTMEGSSSTSVAPPSECSSFPCERSQLARTEEIVLYAGLMDPIIYPVADSYEPQPATAAASAATADSTTWASTLTGSAHWGPLGLADGSADGDASSSPYRKLSFAQTDLYLRNAFDGRKMYDAGRFIFEFHGGTHCSFSYIIKKYLSLSLHHQDVSVPSRPAFLPLHHQEVSV